MENLKVYDKNVYFSKPSSHARWRSKNYYINHARRNSTLNEFDMDPNGTMENTKEDSVNDASNTKSELNNLNVGDNINATSSKMSSTLDMYLPNNDIDPNITMNKLNETLINEEQEQEQDQVRDADGDSNEVDVVEDFSSYENAPFKNVNYDGNYFENDETEQKKQEELEMYFNEIINENKTALESDTWFKPDRLHPKVESLIYWRDVSKSGIVFGAGLIILLAVSCFSVISVFAYLSLTVLACTIAFRIYKTVMGAVQKTSEGHPFKEYLELDLNLSHEKVQQIVNVSVAHVNGFVSELRRLFLVEDFVDSIKFSVILWVLTYIGAWFNGMTLVILAFVSLFTLPKVYENNKQSIDMYLDLVRSKILEITDKVKAAIPIGKKPETDKDK